MADALPRVEQLGARARDRRVLDDFGEMRIQHAAEDLVLFEDLVRVEALGVAQRPQLHRFRDHRRFGVEILLRMREIVRDPVDEDRNVVEQLVGRKDPVRVDGDARRDAVEPPPDELLARLAKRGSEDRVGPARGATAVIAVWLLGASFTSLVSGLGAVRAGVHPCGISNRNGMTMGRSLQSLEGCMARLPYSGVRGPRRSARICRARASLVAPEGDRRRNPPPGGVARQSDGWTKAGTSVQSRASNEAFDREGGDRTQVGLTRLFRSTRPIRSRRGLRATAV
jgi:hypothetical protein